METTGFVNIVLGFGDRGNSGFAKAFAFPELEVEVEVEAEVEAEVELETEVDVVAVLFVCPDCNGRSAFPFLGRRGAGGLIKRPSAVFTFVEVLLTTVFFNPAETSFPLRRAVWGIEFSLLLFDELELELELVVELLLLECLI